MVTKIRLMANFWAYNSCSCFDIIP